MICLLCIVAVSLYNSQGQSILLVKIVYYYSFSAPGGGGGWFARGATNPTRHSVRPCPRIAAHAVRSVTRSLAHQEVSHRPADERYTVTPVWAQAVIAEPLMTQPLAFTMTLSAA